MHVFPAKQGAMKRLLTQEEYLQEEKAPKRTELWKLISCMGIINRRLEEKHGLHQGDNSYSPVTDF